MWHSKIATCLFLAISSKKPRKTDLQRPRTTGQQQSFGKSGVFLPIRRKDRVPKVSISSKELASSTNALFRLLKIFPLKPMEMCVSGVSLEQFYWDRWQGITGNALRANFSLLSLKLWECVYKNKSNIENWYWGGILNSDRSSPQRYSFCISSLLGRTMQPPPLIKGQCHSHSTIPKAQALSSMTSWQTWLSGIAQCLDVPAPCPGHSHRLEKHGRVTQDSEAMFLFSSAVNPERAAWLGISPLK